MDCPFLDLIPAEIRTLIYRYLLDWRYVKYEINAKSNEYNDRRDSILNGPDHRYRFHTSILGANHQIRREAMYEFRQRNLFVSIFQHTSIEWWYGYNYDEFERCGVPLIAHGNKNCTVPGTALSITFNISEAADEGEATCSSPEQDTLVLVAAELPMACVCLQRRLNNFRSRSPIIISRIEVSFLFGTRLSGPGSAHPSSTRTADQILAPLAKLRGFDDVVFYGFGNAFDALIAVMRDRRLSGAETMKEVETQCNEGEQAIAHGTPALALDRYKAALRTIKASSFDTFAYGEVIVGGRFDGLLAGHARNDAAVKIHGYIARIYFQFGQRRLARVYLERILSSFYGSDHRGNSQKFPLEIMTRNPRAIAELLIEGARISIANHNDVEAVDELEKAFRLDPHNQDFHPLLYGCVLRMGARKRRWAIAEEENQRLSLQQFKGAIELANKRIAKGDKACRDEDLALARNRYQAAQEAVHSAWTVTRKHIKQIGDTDWFLLRELGDYKQVHHWATRMDEYNCGCWEAYDLSQTAFTEDYFCVAHYNEAVAFEKQGKLKEAIDKFEDALTCNPGCHATVYQLGALWETHMENERLEMELESERRRWKNRVVKRRRQQFLREARKRERMARGSGYIVGLGSI